MKSDKGRAHAEKAIEINPNHADALYNLVLLLKNQFVDYIKAKTLYEKVSEINPNRVKAYYNLALLFKQHLLKTQRQEIYA